MSLEPAVTLTVRPPNRLFRLVFESHSGRALAPIPKRSTSPRATSTLWWWIAWKCLTRNGRLEKRHWLCTAAKVLMTVSAPIKVLVWADTMLSP